MWRGKEVNKKIHKQRSVATLQWNFIDKSMGQAGLDLQAIVCKPQTYIIKTSKETNDIQSCHQSPLECKLSALFKLHLDFFQLKLNCFQFN